MTLPFNSKNNGFNLCSGLGLMYLFCDTNVHNVLIKSFVNIVWMRKEHYVVNSHYTCMYFKASLAINAVLQIRLR